MTDKLQLLSPSDHLATQAPCLKRNKLVRITWRWFQRGSAIGVLLLFILLFTPITDWVQSAMDCQDPLAPAHYIVCLGGRPDRVIEAARLLQEGYAKTLIVSNKGGAATMMRDLAVEWGAPADHILIDDQSTRTRDHPHAVQRLTGLDPAEDTCIIVTSFNHLPRSRACFRKAGYRHLIMRELRWERKFRLRSTPNWKTRFLLLPKLIYEGAGWVEYWFRGAI